jgi:hypothetical protein
VSVDKQKNKCGRNDDLYCDCMNHEVDVMKGKLLSLL